MNQGVSNKGQAKRVLVVEDSPTQAALEEGWLRRAGFQTRTAPSVRGGLDALRAEDFDAIVTDMRLPDGDGSDVLKAARQKNATTGLIMVSAVPTIEDYKYFADLGAVKFITKPIDPDEFVLSVQKAVDSSHGFRGSVHGVALVDFLQILHLTRRSLEVLVRQGATNGNVAFQNGEIIDAIAHDGTREYQTDEALRLLLSLDGGIFDTGPLSAQRPIRMTGRFDAIVLDSLRVIDESHRASLPPDAVDESSFDLGEPDSVKVPAVSGVPAVGPQGSAQVRIASLPPESRMRRLPFQESLDRLSALAHLWDEFEAVGIVSLEGQSHAELKGSPLPDAIVQLARANVELAHRWGLRGNVGTAAHTGATQSVLLAWNREADSVLVGIVPIRRLVDAIYARGKANTLRRVAQALSRPKASLWPGAKAPSLIPKSNV